MEKPEQPSTSHKTPKGTKPCTPSTCPVCLETFKTRLLASFHFFKMHPMEHNLRKHHQFCHNPMYLMINEITIFLTDYIALGYRRSPHNRYKLLCNYCNYSVQSAHSMVKHIEDDHPEHLRISTYGFISHFRICYSQLD
jgi:hypothetical protein